MTPTSSSVSSSRGFGCVGYGCIIAVVLVVLVLGGLLWGARSAIRSAAERFTTEQPVPVPTVSMDEATRAAVSEKAKEVARQFLDPSSSAVVILTQEELRWWLQGSEFGGTVFLELQGEEVFGTFSFPLKALGSWDAARPILGSLLNRYVTGAAKAKMGVENGLAAINFNSLTLNGQVFDGDALKEASEWVSGFVNSLQNDTDKGGAALARISSMRINNGEALIKLRPLVEANSPASDPTQR